MSPARKSQLGTLLLVMAGGLIRLPIEQSLTAEFRAADLLPPKLETGLREQMSQETFAAAAGGLRSLLASGYEIAAFESYYQQPPRYDLVDKYYNLCVKLQPREWQYWDTYGWMLASNGAAYYADEGGASKGLESSARKKYRDLGIKVLFRGIKQNPDAYRLYQRAADLIGEIHPILNPRPDHRLAALLYNKASETESAKRPPGHPARYLRRFSIYQLAQIPGNERTAYQLLMELYGEGEKERLPTAIIHIKRLEKLLGIPVALRIPDETKPRLMRDLMETSNTVLKETLAGKSPNLNF